jgi:hypothetical protein
MSLPAIAWQTKVYIDSSVYGLISAVGVISLTTMAWRVPLIAIAATNTSRCRTNSKRVVKGPLFSFLFQRPGIYSA